MSMITAANGIIAHWCFTHWAWTIVPLPSSNCSRSASLFQASNRCCEPKCKIIQFFRNFLITSFGSFFMFYKNWMHVSIHLLKLIEWYLNGLRMMDSMIETKRNEMKSHPTWGDTIHRKMWRFGHSTVACECWMFSFYTHTDMQCVMPCLAADAFFFLVSVCVCVRAHISDQINSVSKWNKNNVKQLWCNGKIELKSIVGASNLVR